MILAPSNTILTRAQAGYLVSNQAFGTWNGTATSANLVNALGVVPHTARAVNIYRTDWQGRQLLYPTARTNYYLNSNTMSSTGGIAGATITSGAASPIASVEAFTLTAASADFGGIARFYDSLAGVNGSFAAVVKAGTAAYAGLRVCSAAASGAGSYNFVNLSTLAVNNSVVFGFPLTATSLASGYILLRQSGFIPVGDSGVVDIAITDNTGNTEVSTLGGQTLIFCAPELETTLVGGSYIETGSSAATLTDYTLSGTTVTLAQAPASTAVTNATFYAT